MLEQGGRAHRAEHVAASESLTRRAKTTPSAAGKRVALSRCGETSCCSTIAAASIAQMMADKTDACR